MLFDISFENKLPRCVENGIVILSFERIFEDYNVVSHCVVVDVCLTTCSQKMYNVHAHACRRTYVWVYACMHVHMIAISMVYVYVYTCNHLRNGTRVQAYGRVGLCTFWQGTKPVRNHVVVRSHV